MAQEYNNNFERPEVQHNISYLEGVINRMAANSANCKNWLLAIIAACAAIQPTAVAFKGKILWTLVPVVIFCLLDSYYLGLEQYFRDKMSAFVTEARKGGKEYEALLYKFEKRTVCNDISSVLNGFCSIATWPLYVFLIALILLVYTDVIAL